MTDNQPEEIEDDEFPAVNFRMVNPSGGSSETIEISTHMLGLRPYMLIQADENGDFVVNSSHLSLGDIVGSLAIVVASGLEAEDIDPELRSEILALIAPEDSE